MSAPTTFADSTPLASTLALPIINNHNHDHIHNHIHTLNLRLDINLIFTFNHFNIRNDLDFCLDIRSSPYP